MTHKKKLQGQLETRQREYKRATELYLRSLRREIQTFDRANDKIDARNDRLLGELGGIMERYKMGVDNIRRTDGDLNKEKEKLNQYIMVNFNGISQKIKNVLTNERQKIEHAIDEFDKPAPRKVKTEKTHISLFKKPDKDYMTNYQDLYNSINHFIVKNDDTKRMNLEAKMMEPKILPKVEEDRGYGEHFYHVAPVQKDIEENYQRYSSKKPKEKKRRVDHFNHKLRDFKKQEEEPVKKFNYLDKFMYKNSNRSSRNNRQLNSHVSHSSVDVELKSGRKSNVQFQDKPKRNNPLDQFNHKKASHRNHQPSNVGSSNFMNKSEDLEGFSEVNFGQGQSSEYPMTGRERTGDDYLNKIKDIK